ncbi:MAG: YlbF family regulator [Oscillospiraceae bacterium]|nr:YlbF family regulator [Oscillospiraceae bacterium]
MDIITFARELGCELQKDQRYINYSAAKLANDQDTELQKQIADFHAVQMEQRALRAAGGDPTEISKLNDRLTELYTEVTSNPHMMAFEAARSQLDGVLESINFIITCAANGKDPMTCPDTPPAGCGCGSGGGCSGCSGCG